MADRTEHLKRHTRDELVSMQAATADHKGDHPLRDGIHLLAGAWYATDPHEDWRWMREHAPVYHDPNADVWGITRYDDVMTASKDPGHFSNHHNIRPKTGHVPMMISMDDPEHLQRRKLVNKGFTPRRVAQQETRIRAICDQLIDGVIERGEADWVWDVAAWLPLIVIADMLGIAPEDRGDLLRWSDLLLEGTAGDLDALEEATQAFGEYWAYQSRVIQERRVDPRDDLVSVLIGAVVDGERLDDESLIWESLLILVGGDETTRHVISGGTLELLRHPEQLAALRADPSRLPTAIEEMVRWVSPIRSMSRRLTEDVELGGQLIPAGDEVLLFYPSANRDESRFDAPARFDTARDPNPHIAFGHGPHFCLGASLARLELRCLFEQVLTRVHDLELAADPRDLTYRPSSFVSGLERLPVRFTPGPKVG